MLHCSGNGKLVYFLLQFFLCFNKYFNIFMNDTKLQTHVIKSWTFYFLISLSGMSFFFFLNLIVIEESKVNFFLWFQIKINSFFFLRSPYLLYFISLKSVLCIPILIIIVVPIFIFGFYSHLLTIWFLFTWLCQSFYYSYQILSLNVLQFNSTVAEI